MITPSEMDCALSLSQRKVKVLLLCGFCADMPTVHQGGENDYSLPPIGRSVPGTGAVSDHREGG